MKKLIALLMVLGMASAASATIVDVCSVNAWNADGFQATARTSTNVGGTNYLDPASVTPGMEIMIEIQLNDNGITSTHADFGAYNGTWLKSMQSTLTLSGPATLTARGAKKLSITANNNASFSSVNETSIVLAGPFGEKRPAGWAGGAPGYWSDIVLVYNFLLTVDTSWAGEAIKIDIEPVAGQGQHRAEISDPWTDSDDSALFGDFVIVPEPMTIALLGMGGLGLLYRRRRA